MEAFYSRIYKCEVQVLITIRLNIFFVNAYISIKGPDSPSLQFKELLENEKNNFRLVNTAVSYLGGVPAMINPADMSNTIPSEKV